MRIKRNLLGACMVVLMILGGTTFAGEADSGTRDYLKDVRAYADVLLDKGRDAYGETHSPLFAVTLDRKDVRLFEGEGLQRIASLERGSWGIRSHDRMLSGANPMHDENLYQILYALAVATGDSKYATAADDALQWFFEHCQSPTTGLMAWGEHIGWDFRTEAIIQKEAGTNHEFFRPWVLWDKCYSLAPDPVIRFARGLWDHQIGDQKTGDFSRHARYDQHGADVGNDYPRHGGFYIATWAFAYEKTKDPVFLTAIETLLNHYQQHRHPVSGAIPAKTHLAPNEVFLWPPSNLSLSIDLFDAAAGVPDDLAGKMRASAAEQDDVFLRVNQEVESGGHFVISADSATLGHGGEGKGGSRAFADMWATGYGDWTDAQIANFCFLRYGQTKRDEYAALVRKTAECYADSLPNLDFPVYPGTLGDVIFLMLNAHTLSGDKRFLEHADKFAGWALDHFAGDGCPLPKATDQHDHYEAITRADTLMASLLALWEARNRPDLIPSLIYCDRQRVWRACLTVTTRIVRLSALTALVSGDPSLPWKS